MEDNIIKFASSKQLIKNSKNFLTIKKLPLFSLTRQEDAVFFGWGRKKSGIHAIELSKEHHTPFVLLEDGFIRSIGLGVDGSPSFSIVEDDVGIYYDATQHSKLESILNTYDFTSDAELMQTASEAMARIKEHHISKYNNAPDIDTSFFKEDSKHKVLIVAQTAGDSSLTYGLADTFSTKQMIEDAIQENPQASVYIKIHPDVLSGKKKSDISTEDIPQECTIIDTDINAISLLKHFDKIYTKTSGMGMEALVLGLEVVCYGMPYYAGWGPTINRQSCERRTRKLTVEELFAGAYILYPRYYNPYRNRSSNIIDTIEEIIRQKKKDTTTAQYSALALGDSHIRIFNHYLFDYIFPRKSIHTIYVPSATALGIKNTHSKTQAHNQFLTALNKYNYERIIITLGEVDTSYTIWRNAQQSNNSVDNVLERSLNNYKNFLKILVTYASTIVLSAPLPTLKDNVKCDDSITGIRSTVNISQKERTQLTVRFNQEIKTFCQDQQDIQFIDLDAVSMNKKGTVVSWLRNHKNPCDHHYNRFTYALLLIWRLKNVIKFGKKR